MKTFGTMEELEGYIQKALNESLKDDVFKVTKSKVKEHGKNDVYDTYSPEYYDRRFEQDGLIADNNIVGNIIFDSLLEVKDIAIPNGEWSKDYDFTDPTFFSRWINDGINGKFGRNILDDSLPWLNPRPFIDNTRKELEDEPSIIYDALKKGLNKRGVIK